MRKAADSGTPVEWCEECEEFITAPSPLDIEMHMARHERRRRLQETRQ